MPLRVALSIAAIAVLGPFVASEANAATRVRESSGPSVRTLPCPLLSPDAVIAGPAHAGLGPYAAQRAIGRQPMAKAKTEEARSGRSAGKAVLLNLVAPGAGHIYSGYSRGYVYLGIEAAAWISMFVLREDGNRKEEESRAFAGDPFNEDSAWNFARYESEGYCNVPSGGDADSTLRALWQNDRDIFYDLIDRDLSYRCGWAEGTWEEYRDMRKSSDELLSWAGYASAAVLINHAVSVFDIVRLTRNMNFEVPGGASLMINFKPDLPHPTGSVRISKAF